MARIELDDVVAQSPTQVGCDVNDEAILLDTMSGIYYGLDPVGKRVWELIADDGRTVAAVIDQLCTEFEVTRDRCTTEVCGLFERMLDAGLITRRG